MLKCWLPVLFVFSLFLSACGGAPAEPTSTPPPPTETPPPESLEPVELDLCSLLETAEVEPYLLGTVAASGEMGVGACMYSASVDNAFYSLSVSAAQSDEAKGLVLAGLQIAVMFGGDEDTLAAGQALMEEMDSLTLWDVISETYTILGRMGYEVEPAPSFGETALWGWSEPMVNTLILVEGETYLALNIVGLEQEDARAASSILAPLAFSRLPAAFTVPTSGSMDMNVTIDLGDVEIEVEDTVESEPTANIPPPPPSAAVWVANFTDNSVYKLDPLTMEILAVIPAGEGPVDIEAIEGSVFVANQGEGSIWRIDPQNDVVTYRVNTGASEFLRVEVDENYIYAVACHEHMIEIFHYPETRALFARIPIQDCWNAEVAFGSLWVGQGERTLLRIDPETQEEIAAINVGRGPYLMDVTEDWLWVANANQRGLWRINPDINSMFDIVGIPVEGNVLDIAVGEGAVWVAVDHFVVKLDPDTGEVLGTVDTIKRATGVAAGFGYVYVTNYQEGTVLRLDADTLEIIDSVQIGGRPWGIGITE